MSVYYCGIDLSISCTGLAVVQYLGDGKFKLINKKSIVPNPKAKGFDKKIESLNLFKFALDNFNDFKQCQFFVFENYSFGSPGRLTDLAELAALYKYEIQVGRNKTYDAIAPQSVKKVVSGSGKGTKEMVRESLSKYIEDYDDIIWENYDESDAVAVAVAYGLTMERIRNEQEQSAEDNDGVSGSPE